MKVVEEEKYNVKLKMSETILQKYNEMYKRKSSSIKIILRKSEKLVMRAIIMLKILTLESIGIYNITQHNTTQYTTI